MMYGLDRLEDLPLSIRLIREMHARLMGGDQGGDKNPGEFRRSQNWIGGTWPGNAMFVPAPPNQIAPCLSDLEAFLHEEASGLPPLIKAGLLHVQFETIHPLLDGNGLIGRLLITLYLSTRRRSRASRSLRNSPHAAFLSPPHIFDGKLYVLPVPALDYGERQQTREPCLRRGALTGC